MQTTSFAVRPTDALIVVDPQNDFLPGGALPVKDGNRIFDPINRLMPLFLNVFATRDWHTDDNSSFEAQGGPWPVHCVQNTKGAEFSPLFHAQKVTVLISKGSDPQSDGYSGFAGTDLAAQLKARHITRVFVCGLATDYCVKATAIQAKAEGFESVVLTDAIAGVNANEDDDANAIFEMQDAGVTLASTFDLHR